jgi:acyl-CoA synthetase (AMP-forming)/AMP-acid ligase II
MENGTTACLAPKFSVSAFWQDVRDSRATWLIYVGETLRYLVAAPPSHRDKDHNIHTVYGNGLRPDVWNRFQERFGIERMWEMFNSTEGMLALSNPCQNDFFAHAVGHHGFLQRWKYRDALVAVETDHETENILRDVETGFATRLPLDGRGEVLIRIPHERQFPGYWNNPEATEKKYVRDVFQKGDCYYRTGDALRMDSEGRWFFVDR